MTAFGWKRKAGENILKATSSKFSADSDSEDFPKDIGWVNSFKRKRQALQTNCELKSKELKAEGIKLAESQRFNEAVSAWNKALSLVPADYKILEMKAQALLQLNSPFEAVQAAERAVRINPCWWIAFQTLGRAQLGIGDIVLAKRSFSKAIHLNPSEKELWEDDLKWTLSLIEKKNKLANGKDDSRSKLNEVSEITYDEDGYIITAVSAKENVIHCRF